MSLNNGTADSLANDICAQLGVSDPTSIGNWEKICRQIYSHLKTDVVVNVASVSGVTTGGGTSGPGSGTVS